MKRVVAIAAPTAALMVLTLNGGLAKATESSATWPAAHPLPINPGTVISQTSTTAVIRSTDTVAVVQSKLDNLYLEQNGCTRQVAVNKPRDYFCHNLSTGEIHEIVFTFAALDPTTRHPARSQTNAYHLHG